MANEQCRIMYIEGPTIDDDEVEQSLSEQLSDLGEIDENTLLIAPAGATEDQVVRILHDLLENGNG